MGVMPTTDPMLTTRERAAIDAGRWFSGLSPMLRHDILRMGRTKRFHDGAAIAMRGEMPQDWWGVARGAVRVSSSYLQGKQVTLTFVEPGVWFGDIALLDGEARTHDAHAHGATTLVCVAAADFLQLLDRHPEFYRALARLQARRLRHLFTKLDDLHALPLRSRLAKQLLELTRSFGQEGDTPAAGIRIALPLPQEDLAQLVGASRQRVNLELKSLEREDAIRVSRGGLVVRRLSALQAAACY